MSNRNLEDSLIHDNLDTLLIPYIVDRRQIETVVKNLAMKGINIEQIIDHLRRFPIQTLFNTPQFAPELLNGNRTQNFTQNLILILKQIEIEA